MVSAVGAAGGTSAATTQFGMRPRVRSGYALKRLEESEGSKRFVLRDLNTGKFLRLSDRDAEIFKLLDGQHSLVDIISHAEQAFGGVGAVRVARLLSDLGERGFLAGVASGDAQAERAAGLPPAPDRRRARRPGRASGRSSRSSTSAAAGSSSPARCSR